MRTRIALKTVALAVLVVVSACGGTASTSPAPQTPAGAAGSSAAPKATDSGPTAANPVTLMIGQTAGITSAPFYVGVEKGLFLKHGIDLKLVIMPSPPDVVKGLQAGTIQLAATSWTASMPAVAQGVPLRVVALTAGRPNVANYDDGSSIVLRPGVTAKTVADLKGLKVAHVAGGNPEIYLRLSLIKAGLDPDKDVKLVPIPTANQFASLQRGDVDAASMSDLTSTQTLMQLTGSRLLIRGGGVFEARTLVLTMDPWLKQNPVVLEHFLAGDYESLQYVRQHAGDTAIAASHYVGGTDVAVIAGSLENTPYDPRWSNLVQEGFDGSTQAMLTAGTVKTMPKSSDILVLDLLTNAQKKYPEYFSDLK